MTEYSMNQIEPILNHNLRKQYVKIELLDWYENVTEEITGIVKTGNYSENGTNMSRRNLTLTFSSVNQDNELLINKLQISKKIKVYFGLQNYTQSNIKEDIVWFNLGIFVPVSVSLSHSEATSSINLSCSDKMCLLNGTIGGMVSAPTTFTTKDDEGKYHSMSWRDIFINTATTIGNENSGKIIIENVPDIIRVVGQIKTMYGVKDKLIHVEAPPKLDGNRCIIDGWLPDTYTNADLYEKLILHQGQKLYGLRKFGPPDPISISDGTSQEDYIINIGENVTKVFSDIISQLSNAHQCYYDAEGNLRLEPIHDCMVYELDDKYIQNKIYDTNPDMFYPDFTRLPITYDLTNKPTNISFSNTQKFDNIKNDFVLQGEKGKRLEIVIDKKPSTEEVINWFKEAANQYSGDINSPVLDYCNEGFTDELRRNIYYKTRNKNGDDVYVTRYPIILNEDGKTIKYAEVELENLPWQIAHGIRSWHIRKLNNLGGGQVNQYNINMLFQSLGNQYNYRWGYECEQLIYQKTVDKEDNWKSDKGIFNLFNWSEKNGKYWKTGYSVDKPAYQEEDSEVVDYSNPNFDEIGDSKTWNFWFDIIDSSGFFAEYSIEKIGRRTYSQKIDGCNLIFRTGYDDIIVLEEDYINGLDDKEYILKKLREKNMGYAIIKNKSYYFNKIDVFIDEDGNLKEPEGFVLDKNTKDGSPGTYTPNEDESKKIYIGGMYTGSTDGISQKSYDLHDLKENETPPTFLMFFPQYEAEEDARYVHPKKYDIDFTIPKGEEFIEEDRSNGEKKKIFGNIVSYPEGYPLDLGSLEKPKETDKERAENELKSPLMMIYSDSRKNNTLKGFSDNDRFHPCFITIRYNYNSKKYEYWGPKAEGSKEYLWREYSISENDAMIAYCKNPKTSEFNFLFNMDELDLGNLLSYGSGNDLFSCLQPIVVQKTNTADTISVSMLINPKLEVNTLIRVSDEKANIQGIYKITNISYALEKSTMTIQAVKMNKYLI